MFNIKTETAESLFNRTEPADSIRFLGMKLNGRNIPEKQRQKEQAEWDK
jgi:hypothetical protein